MKSPSYAEHAALRSPVHGSDEAWRAASWVQIGQGMDQNDPTVLVVHDDEDGLARYRLVLEKTGFRTVCRLGPAEALVHLGAVRPHLTTTDLMAGEFGAGFQRIRRTREHPALASLPDGLVTTTGSVRSFNFEPRNAVDPAAVGPDAFLCKPMEVKALCRKALELLPRRESGPPQRDTVNE